MMKLKTIKNGKWYYPVVAALIFGSYTWTVAMGTWVYAAANEKDKAVVQQVVEIKEDMNKRLDRQDERQQKQVDRVLSAIKDLREDIRNGR